MKKPVIIFLGVVFVSVFLVSPCIAGWLIFHKPEYKGKIIDAETKQPIEGVVVVAIYRTNPIISGPAGGNSSIIDIKETKTNEEGEFHISSYTTLMNPNSYEFPTDFIIYKGGYASYPNNRTEIYPFMYCGPSYLFTKEIGTEGEVKRNSKVALITNGIVELPPLDTWEERRKASMIYMSDIPKEKWPLLNTLIKKENVELRQSFDEGSIEK